MRHARNHYVRADGSPTTEVKSYADVSAIVRTLYGHTLAGEFGPLALKVCRQEFIERGWCRKVVNAQIGRLKRIFRWACSEELIPATVFHGLQSVTGLARGRSGVRDHEPIRPVDPAIVDATLPLLTRHVRGLVQFQRLTGCRPGEACAVRRCDLDTSGPVWWYRPADHKLTYREKERIIAIGPKLQAILADFPTDDPTDFIFSPARSVAEVSALRSANRRTPKFASHMRRNESKRVAVAERKAQPRYTTGSYGRAIKKALEAENDRRISAILDAGGKAEDAKLIPHWHPHQLRHLVATEIRRAHGIEAAKSALGHAALNATEIYAERDLGVVERIAAANG
ncbi:MAG: site-specific integrase [Gemmataceae bacterium]|nr:site-specific integrase [Gemmataceae bacterium]